MSSSLETKRTIIKIHISLSRILPATAFILLIPLVAMQITNEVVWTLTDFIVAGALLIAIGLTYSLATMMSGNLAYRSAMGIALLAVFLIIWVNLAVGIIGNEDNPANLMFIVVLLVGIVGAVTGRFKPLGMARTLLSMAFTQFLIALIVLSEGLGSNGPLVKKISFSRVGFLLRCGLDRHYCFERQHRRETALKKDSIIKVKLSLALGVIAHGKDGRLTNNHWAKRHHPISNPLTTQIPRAPHHKLRWGARFLKLYRKV